MIKKQYRQVENEIMISKHLTACNTDVVSGGLMCKLAALYLYSSSLLIDYFVLRTARTHSPRTLGYINHCLDGVLMINMAVKY